VNISIFIAPFYAYTHCNARANTKAAIRWRESHGQTNVVRSCEHCGL